MEPMEGAFQNKPSINHYKLQNASNGHIIGCPFVIFHDVF